MSLQMIIGGADSGYEASFYTHLIEAALEAPEEHFYLIVPEQYTMQTQRKITGMHPGHGVMNIDVVSFARLAHHVFEEIGGLDRLILEDTGKTMIIRKLLKEHREDLGVFARSARSAGFPDQMKSMLSELFQYSVKPEELYETIGAVGEASILGRKLKDITVIYEAFRSYMGEDYMTAEELLDELADRISMSKKLRDSRIYIDSFTGFTPAQYRLIAELLKMTKQLVISLCIAMEDRPEELGTDYELFHLTKETLGQLKKLCMREHIEVDEDIVLASSGEDSDLACIGRGIFRFGRRSVYRGVPEHVRLYTLNHPVEEVRFAAEEIKRLVMQEDMSFRQFAMITSDVARYRTGAQRIFADMDLPLFIDDKQDISDHSCIEMIKSAVDVVVQDYSYESVFRYLRAGYSRLSDDEIDVLENYVLASGVRGHKKWQNAFERLVWPFSEHDEASVKRAEEKLAYVNELKDRVCEEVAPLSLFAGENHLGHYAQALEAFFEKVGLEEKLAAFADGFHERKDYVNEQAYRQVYVNVTELLEKSVRILGDEVMSATDFMDILEAGFTQIKIGVIPPTLDQIVLGDLTRTRIADVDVVFILGCNDGVLPAPAQASGLLSDREKEKLCDCDVMLAPTAKENSFRERYYIYSALMKAKKLLVLTYAALDDAGKEIRPSSLLSEIRYLLPELKRKAPVADRRERVLTSKEASASLLIRGLKMPEVWAKTLPDFSNGMMPEENNGDISEKKEAPEQLQENHAYYTRLLMDLYAWFLKAQESKDQLLSWEKTIYGDAMTQDLAKELVRLLYGDSPAASISKLEKYASCAYAHFLSYGLGIDERKVSKLRSPEMGTILHAAMEKFGRAMNAKDGDAWAAYTDEQCDALMRECAKEAALENLPGYFEDGARNAYLLEKIIGLSCWSAKVIVNQIRRGDFRPAYFEKRFFDQTGNVRLTGIVDRCDIAVDDDQTLVRVVDYKSGPKKLELTDVYYGLSMQLIVYLEEMIRMIKESSGKGHETVKAGMYYYHFDDKILKEEDDDGSSLIDKRMDQLRLEGLTNTDETVVDKTDHKPDKKPAVAAIDRKKDGSFLARAQVADPEAFEALAYVTKKRMAEISERWMQGDIQKDPFYLKKKNSKRTACDYCKFKSICRFDEDLPGYHYHKLKAMDKSEDIWNAFYEEAAGEERED